MVETRKNSPTKRVFLDNSYKTKGEQILMLPSRQEFARFFGALETDKNTQTIPYR